MSIEEKSTGNSAEKPEAKKVSREDSIAPDDPRVIRADRSRKTVTSYYQYPVRSFLRHKRAYLLLAASILCMVILSTSVLIFYASRYEAEVETLRRQLGPQHVQFYDVDPAAVPLYTERSYIRKSLALDLFAAVDNPDLWAAFETVYLTEFTEQVKDFFYLDLVSGDYPREFGDIIVSEDAVRYFSCFSPDVEQDVTIQVHNVQRTIPLRVTGVFKGAETAEPYAFCNAETAEYLRGDGYAIDYTTDVFLVLDGKTPVAYKRGVQHLIDDLGLMSVGKDGEAEDIYYEERNEMLSEHALVKPYYEGNSMRLMFLFSILPAVIALVVFIYLDMQKNLGELASLSMIGATWKQIFRMQLLKYGAIFCCIFPFGVLGAAMLMGFVCALTNKISPDRVFLWFRFDGVAVLLLFLLCALILTLIILWLSKRLTGIAYSEMLSAAHQSGNIFVAKTSNLLFQPGRVLERISVLFFTRNRRVNLLFCSVIVLLICVYSFFTMQTAKEYGAAPDSAVINQIDYTLYGDEGVSDAYDTMDPELQELIEDIPGVASVQREYRVSDFYKEYYQVDIQTMVSKQIVSNAVKNGSFGTKNAYKVNKRGSLPTRLLGYDSDLLNLNYEKDVVDGDLVTLFENEKTVAIVVNAFSRGSDHYYHAGDKISISYSGVDLIETEEGLEEQEVVWAPVEYTVGAVIYRPDEDAYERIVTIVCSPETFTEISDIPYVYSYSVRCTDDEPETLEGVRQALSDMEYEHLFRFDDMHEALRQAKAQAMHTVLYVYLMKFFVLVVTVLLMIAMTRFMLEVRMPSMRAMILIGAQNAQLMRIQMFEFLIAAGFSSIVGIILTLIGTGIISIRFEIPFYFTPLTTFLVFLSMLLLTAVNIGIPVLLCEHNIRRGKLN